MIEVKMVRNKRKVVFSGNGGQSIFNEDYCRWQISSTSAVGDHRKMPVLGEVNGRAKTVEEIQEVLDEMKSRKGPGVG